MKEGPPEVDQCQPEGGDAAGMGKRGRLDEPRGPEHCRQLEEGVLTPTCVDAGRAAEGWAWTEVMGQRASAGQLRGKENKLDGI
eukprot:14573973-Heterocapsa_arctica.AAC.1